MIRLVRYLLAARKMRKLRREFYQLKARVPGWGGPIEEEAFRLFCHLENLGPDRVRHILATDGEL
jgi:hypothetical protein